MPVEDFTVKAIIVTLVLSWLLWAFYPRYEYVDSRHVLDAVSGKIESR
jgi:regulatory protein YycH of two-component signal transduction system YycFG